MLLLLLIKNQNIMKCNKTRQNNLTIKQIQKKPYYINTAGLYKYTLQIRIIQKSI